MRWEITPSAGPLRHAGLLSASRCARFLVLRPEFPAAGGSTSEPVTAAPTEPQDQGGNSQRWAGGTSAATPKAIPCPGSPSAAMPASSLSTSPTQSDSDELRRQGHQVKGLQCQMKFLVTALAFLTRAPRYLGRFIIIIFLSKWWVVTGWVF